MFIVMPGIGGSDADHWQTLWEADDPAFHRFAPSSWDAPDLNDWMSALDKAVAQATTPPVLVAHSLACLVVAHWAAHRAAKADIAIAGALLVSAPDPDGPHFPDAASSFRGVPDQALPFPTLILASSDDPYADVGYARRLADQLRATLIELGPLGHINSDSRLGAWDDGRQLLTAFAAGCTRPRSGLHGRE